MADGHADARKTIMPARRSILWPVFSIVAVFWILMMGTLVQRMRSGVPSMMPERPPGVFEGIGRETRWMGVYLRGKKIGHAVTSSERRPDGTVRLFDRSVMRLTVQGTVEEITTKLDCVARGDYSLESLSFEMKSGDHQLEVEGRVEGGRLFVTLITAGDTSDLTFTLPKETFLPASMELLLGGKDLRPGETYAFPLFDPMTLTQEQARVTVIGTEPLSIEGEEVVATKLDVWFLGISQSVWLDDLGRILKEEAPMGLVMVRESPESAVAWGPETGSVDLLTLYSVPVDETIAVPRDLIYVKAEMSGCDPDRLELEPGRQRVLSEDPCVVEITAAQPSSVDGPEAKYSILLYGDALRPTPLIQAAHPEIVARTMAILAQDPKTQGLATPALDPWSKSRRLATWVHRHVRKIPTASMPSALDVLHTLEGDCNEHAVLLAALTRAAGIPAKVILGVVYQDGAFYYHAWNRVYVGEWVDIDAAFGQEVADASHIALLEGDAEQLPQLLGLIGQLDIDILEYRYR
ncbi:hypothetical protein AMJ39_08130 [candidate division TA06 bacterium DG_24]|uniref:Transglutaminase-like domain-containing protein n=2 Tax=Bacteria division TA06 TaxID=1156500 RepID=A0A0S7WQB6_UNCT6|nr:MAG: hypothetical protein AMJ39_08130 [candidate division TA06 bacterium DG_24]